MLKSHKIALDPTNKQATYFAKAAGAARKAYNWGLHEWGRQYEEHKKDSTQPRPSEASLRRQLNAIKREIFPWMMEITKNAPQMAIIQLGDAFKNFFAGRAKYPTNRRKWIDDRFSLTNDQFCVEASRIRIPRLGWVSMREALRFTGKIMSATVSRQAGRWFVSITVEIKEDLSQAKAENQGALGIDLGVSALATLSTGEEAIIGPKPHKALIKRVRRLSKSLSRKQKKSSNWKKAKKKLSKLHAFIANVREDALHKSTTKLTSAYSLIGIEDLNVAGMMKNRHLSRAIADMGFYEFRRQLEYKAAWCGGVVVVADRWFASSKICSNCQYKLDKLTLSVREWTCPSCQSKHDRDINAAINLRNYAVSSTVSACGEEGSGFQSKRLKTKPTSVKQEVNAIATFR